MYSIALSISALRSARSPLAPTRRARVHAVGIAMHESGRRAVAVLAERVFLLASAAVEFGQRGDRRPAQTLPRVTGIDQAHVIGRHADRQWALMTSDRGALVVRHRDHPVELLETADAVTVLPAPIVPFGRFDAGEVTLAKVVARRADDETGTGGSSQLNRRTEAGAGEFSKLRRGSKDDGLFGGLLGSGRTRRLLLQRHQFFHLR
jgi:hypothetical protein